MEIRANFILIGLFSLLSILGILCAILWLSKGMKSDDSDLYSIEFTESVTGLSVGNPVLFSGIRVGQVKHIQISDKVPGAVKVLISVLGDTPVRQNSEARLEMMGLTGSSGVAISGGTADSPLVNLAEGKVGTINSRRSPIAAVINEAPDTMAQAKNLLMNLEKMTSDENRESINEILKNFAKLSATLADSSDDIAGIIKHTESSLSEFDKLMKTANSATARVDKTLAGLSPGLTKVTQEALPQLRALIVESRSLVDMLTRVARKIDNDPRRFFFGTTIMDYHPQQ